MNDGEVTAKLPLWDGYTALEGMPSLPLAEWRDRRGLSQEELARKAGVSEKTIWNVENTDQRPHPRNRRAIAEALGIEIYDIAEFARGGSGDSDDADGDEASPPANAPRD